VGSLEKKSAEDKNFALLPQNIGNYRAIELPTRHFTSRRVLCGASFFSLAARKKFPPECCPRPMKLAAIFSKGMLALEVFYFIDPH